jgi:hypothetical protein
MRELLNSSLRGFTGMGSFDCGSLRFAQRNFAQDDRT